MLADYITVFIKQTKGAEIIETCTQVAPDINFTSKRDDAEQTLDFYSTHSVWSALIQVSVPIRHCGSNKKKKNILM